MGKVLIVGGSPSIGKSTIAHTIGKRNNLAVISTNDGSEDIDTLLEMVLNRVNLA